MIHHDSKKYGVKRALELDKMEMKVKIAPPDKKHEYLLQYYVSEEYFRIKKR